MGISYRAHADLWDLECRRAATDAPDPLRVPDHEFDPLKWRVSKTLGSKFFLRRADELLSRLQAGNVYKALKAAGVA
jgi:hypothetical protein